MHRYTAANKAAIAGRTTAGMNVFIPTHFPPATPAPPNNHKVNLMNLVNKISPRDDIGLTVILI